MKRTGTPGNLGSTSLLPSNEADSLAQMGTRLLLRLYLNRTGAVTVEYAMLTGLVAITCTSAFLAFGPALSGAFEQTRGMLMLPIP